MFERKRGPRFENARRNERGIVQISCESMERALSADPSEHTDPSRYTASETAHLESCSTRRREAEERATLFTAIPALEQIANDDVTRDAGTRALFTRTVLASVRDEPIPVRRQERALARPLRWGAVAATTLLALALFLTETPRFLMPLDDQGIAGSATSLETLFEQLADTDEQQLWEEGVELEDSFGGDYMLCEFIPSGDSVYGIDSLSEMKF